MASRNAAQTHSVLLVDDNENMVFVVEAMLELMGIQADLAANGQIAVNKALAKSYATILMDMEMPVMDGLIATKTIRQNEHDMHSPPAWIIGITAHKGMGIRLLCERAGMNEFLSKPFLVEQLEEKLGVRSDALSSREDG